MLATSKYTPFTTLSIATGYFCNCKSGYSFRFNGKENDNEAKGEGNQQDYGMRIYDSRVGKFLSVDPLTNAYPELTPYQNASDNPIANIDIDGLEGVGTVASTSTARPTPPQTRTLARFGPRVRRLGPEVEFPLEQPYYYDNNGHKFNFAPPPSGLAPYSPLHQINKKPLKIGKI